MPPSEGPRFWQHTPSAATICEPSRTCLWAGSPGWYGLTPMQTTSNRKQCGKRASQRRTRPSAFAWTYLRHGDFKLASKPQGRSPSQPGPAHYMTIWQTLAAVDLAADISMSPSQPGVTAALGECELACLSCRVSGKDSRFYGGLAVMDWGELAGIAIWSPSRVITGTQCA
jgi:hypothetical protein